MATLIDAELIAKALATIGSSPANREYFFANLRSPGWLAPLRAAGRFKSPVQAVRDNRGIAFVSWPESGYLARMAAENPDIVRDIILESEETDNERVHQDFVDAAIRMTPEAAAEVAKFEAAWIREQSSLYTLYPEKVGELMSYLATTGQVEAAVSLGREVLLIVPPKEAEPEEEEDSFRLSAEPRGKCRQWEYQRVLLKHLPDLVKAAPERALMLMADLLETALRIRSRGQQDKREDYSWIWRPKVESNRFDDFSEALVSATRDAAISMSNSGETTVRAADLLWSRQWRMFRRLAAYVLHASQTTPIETIEQMLTQSIEYEDFPGHSPEFDELLTDCFAKLSQAGKARVLSLIEQGPDLHGLKKRRGSEGKPEAEAEAEIAEVADSWRLKWLHRIRQSLPPSWGDTYSALVTRFGEPRSDETSAGIHSWVGPTSPKSSDELREMSGDELIAFLQTWHSTGEWNAPSAEGLGRGLSAMLAAEPQKLAASATLLCGLDPTYVRSAIDGFTAALKSRQSFQWASVIELCEWAVAQGNEARSWQQMMDSDPDWNWTRKSIGWFLNEALKMDRPTPLPLLFRERVWVLLEALADDPVFEQERPYGRGMFVGSISLNETRGVALDGILQYARWLHVQGAIVSEDRKLDAIPELKQAIEKHIANDKSDAAREVLGRGFPTLFWLDKEWAITVAAAIFGEEERALGNIAMANYLLFCPPYNDLLPVLRKYYRQAIDRIAVRDGKDVDEVDRHLVQHLALFYWRGKIGIDSEDLLIRDFFGKVSAKLRSETIEFIGRNLHGAEPVMPEILNRLTGLWEWRLAELRQRRCDGEPIPFGIWFASGQFDLDWSFDNLLSVLRLCHKAELDFWVVERLAVVARDRSAAAVQALGMMIEGDQEGWAMHGWSDHPRTVLATALNSADQRAQEEAKRVIHLLGARGWYGYRDLLRVSDPTESAT